MLRRALHLDSHGGRRHAVHRLRRRARGNQRAREPVEIEQVEGTELARLTLTDQAAKRLDIQTAPVDEAAVAATANGAGDLVERLVVPYAAVLYDRAGKTWAYTNPETLVFVRHAITVDYVDGERAVLSTGPDVGTPVVVVGATELFGAEVGVDH